MNENSKLVVLTIKDWLHAANDALEKESIPSASLDAELLMAFYLKVDRTYLHAHSDGILAKKDIANLNKLLARRLKREPLAYITGSKEFYGRKFQVDSRVLIPRPESENIIDFAIKVANTQDKPKIIDVGTGSGCLAITLALEIKDAKVYAVDISEKALELAKVNAKLNNANIVLVESNLLKNIKDKFDIIVANLPYVDKIWQVSPETIYEPSLALFADDKGKSLITKLIDQAPKNLNSKGYLILEADPRQHQDIANYAALKKFRLLKIKDYIILLQYED